MGEDCAQSERALPRCGTGDCRPRRAVLDAVDSLQELGESDEDLDWRSKFLLWTLARLADGYRELLSGNLPGAAGGIRAAEEGRSMFLALFDEDVRHRWETGEFVGQSEARSLTDPTHTRYRGPTIDPESLERYRGVENLSSTVYGLQSDYVHPGKRNAVDIQFGPTGSSRTVGVPNPQMAALLAWLLAAQALQLLTVCSAVPEPQNPNLPNRENVLDAIRGEMSDWTKDLAISRGIDPSSLILDD